jgi:hypothetical protein
LNVIGHLERGTGLIASDMAAVTGLPASKWVDVNGDARASALDALNVINELGRRHRPATPIQLAQAEQIRKPKNEDVIVDEFYANLAEDDSESLVVEVGNQAASLLETTSLSYPDHETDKDAAKRLESVEFVLESELTWIQ